MRQINCNRSVWMLAVILATFNLPGCAHHNGKAAIQAVPASSNFGTQAPAQTQPEPRPPITFEIHEDQIMTPEQQTRAQEEMIDVMAQIGAGPAMLDAIHKERAIIRKYLPPSEAEFERSIVYEVKYSEVINAWSKKDENGKPHVWMTSGLYRNLDNLVVAEVISHQYNKPLCGVKYAEYLMQAMRRNAKLAAQQPPLPSPETYTPDIFIHQNPGVCPIITPDLLPDFNKPPDKWWNEYQKGMRIGMIFLMIHETTHLKNRDYERALLTVRGPYGMSQKREMEIQCDDAAISFIGQMGESQLSALPLMYLFAGLDDFAVNPDWHQDHPIMLERIKNLFRTSAKSNGAKRFNEDLKQNVEAIHERDEFVRFLNQSFSEAN